MGFFSSTATRKVDWGTGTSGDVIKVSLFTSALTLDTSTQDTFDFYNDLSNEVSGSGYSAQTLTGKSVTYDPTTNHVQLRAANTTFTATGTGWNHRYIVVWVDTAGASSADPLLGWIDTGGTTTVPAGNYVIDWDDTDGVLAVTVI